MSNNGKGACTRQRQRASLLLPPLPSVVVEPKKVAPSANGNCLSLGSSSSSSSSSTSSTSNSCTRTESPPTKTLKELSSPIYVNPFEHTSCNQEYALRREQQHQQTDYYEATEAMGSSNCCTQEAILSRCIDGSQFCYFIGQCPLVDGLAIEDYRAEQFPRDFLTKLPLLLKLTIQNCEHLTSVFHQLILAANPPTQPFCLQYLKLSELAVLTNISSSICKLTQLRELKIERCARLAALPVTISQLTKLRCLHVTSCPEIQLLPDSLLPKGLVFLSFQMCSGLQQIPESIGHCCNLQILNLMGCSSLNCLPSNINALEDLSRLNLSWCSALEEAAFSNFGLKSLTHLNLAGCFPGVKEVPAFILTLHQTTTLNISWWFDLSTLPLELFSLLRLQTLELTFLVGLISLPECVGSLSSLQILSLEKCDNLTSLPEAICQLDNLIELNLCRCFRLFALPNNIPQLAKLSILRLAHCVSLTNLDFVGYLPSLSFLDIRGCSLITKLPPTIPYAQNLRELYFSFTPIVHGATFPVIDSSSDVIDSFLRNPIDQKSIMEQLQKSLLEDDEKEEVKIYYGLPFVLGNLSKLSILCMKHCEYVEELPDCLLELQNLSLWDLTECTNLFVLPKDLGQLSGLQHLSVKKCTKLTCLPGSVGLLQRLQTLDISYCPITDLPENIGSLSSLITLIASHTCLHMLPETIVFLEKLEQLDVSHCSELSFLPRAMQTGLAKLRRLDLSFCPMLLFLPNFDQLANLRSLQLQSNPGLLDLSEEFAAPNLQVLNLHNCNLSRLPTSLCSLHQLEHLDLSGNKSLASLPSQLGNLRNLQFLDLGGCKTLQQPLPFSMGHLRSLQFFHIDAVEILPLSMYGIEYVLPDNPSGPRLFLPSAWEQTFWSFSIHAFVAHVPGTVEFLRAFLMPTTRHQRFWLPLELRWSILSKLKLRDFFMWKRQWRQR
eukprot:m.4759 g.4759  ORF g.4759 m.4759 type:complete len:947 (-) comp5166_c0_seq1:53-2893(-)